MGLAPRTLTRLAAALLVAPLVGAPALLMATSADAQAAGTVNALNSNQFDPPTLEVAVGTKVTWTNEGAFHTVTGGDGQEDPASPIGNHTLTDASSKVEITFDKPGTYPYFCEPHVALGMKGEIVVTAAGGGAAPASGAASAAPATGDASASGAPRPDENPSDADPANVDPGAIGASESAGPGSENSDEDADHVPGSTADDNKTLHDIEEQLATEENKLSGFNSLLAAGTLALIALCVAVFASTRPRRQSQ